jgi:hypothetical protein
MHVRIDLSVHGLRSGFLQQAPERVYLLQIEKNESTVPFLIVQLLIRLHRTDNNFRKDFSVDM